MKSSTYTNWFRRLLILGAVVGAGAFASTAGAVGRPPDVQDTMTALHSTPAGLKADGLRWQGIAQTYGQLQPARNFPTQLGLEADGLRLQGMAKVYQQLRPAPDVVERYAATHGLGTGISGTQSTVVSRPPDVQDVASSVNAAAPDVIERYVAVHPSGIGVSSNATEATRPPDIGDAALAVQYGSTVQSTGFDWGDWAIGIGSGVCLALLVGAAFLMSRQLRDRVQTA